MTLIPRFDTCCLCYDLRSGSLLIAAVTMIGSIIVTILSVLALIHLSEELYNIPMDYFKERFVHVMVNTYLITNILLNVVYMIMTLILIVGVLKYNKSFIRSFALFNIIMITVCLFMVAATLGFIQPRYSGISLFFLGLDLYFTSVVYNYYMSLKDKKDGGTVEDLKRLRRTAEEGELNGAYDVTTN